MAIFPTTKTVPLSKDIGVFGSKTRIGTSDRQDLESVLTAIDQTLTSIEAAAAAALAVERQARIDADADLQSQLNSEIANRIADVNQEESRALAAELLERNTRITQDGYLQSQIDAERYPLRMFYTTGASVSITPAYTNRLNSTAQSAEQLAIPNSSTVSDFPGATIDFDAGTITYSNNPTPVSFENVSTVGQAGLWIKYAIVLLPTTPNSILVLPGDTFGLSMELTPAPFFDGGIPIGIVALQVNELTGGWNNLTQQNLITLLPGLPGLPGSCESPLDPAPESNFVYYTRSDFAVDKKTHFGSTTGSDNILGLKKITLNSGEIVLTETLSGSQIKEDAVPINAAQAQVLYKTGKVDPLPAIELSRDGGLNWHSATISLPGSQGDMVVGDITFPESNTPIIDSGTAAATSVSGTSVAAIFTPSYAMTISSFDIYFSSVPSMGIISAKIMTVSTGIPQVDLSSSGATFLGGLDIPNIPGYFNFSVPTVTLNAGQSYALVVQSTGVIGNISVRTTATNVAQNNSSATNAGSGWTANGSKLAFRLYGSGCDLKMKVTASTDSEMLGFGVNYVLNNASGILGETSYEERTITATEASTGLITLNWTRYTPGMHQLMCLHSGHIFMSPDFTEVSNNRVKFAAGFFETGDVVRFYTSYGFVDGTSTALSKFASIHNIIVGSEAQVSAGLATHSNLASAVAAAPSGTTILVLAGTYTGSVAIPNDVLIQGQGRGTVISGNVTVTANYSTMKNLKFGGNLTVSGSGNFITECFAATSSTITDSGTANKKEIIQE